ncbi:MAG: phosphoenolpyruvate synthase, partial [Burkholderiales bacterium]|nr:phosphoenolpyruvate synthase [Burkholderiales bacterium]
MSNQPYVLPFEQLGIQDVPSVGGKNASLGEMIQNLSHLGVRVPGGFATTAQAFRDFLVHSDLTQRINQALQALDVSDVTTLAQVGKQIRQWVVEAPLQPALAQAIRTAWQQMAAASVGELSVAVRSSATAEDLPDASFAGQQETYLNVVGIDTVLLKVREVFASLYNDRAIAYRVHHGFEHADVALSAGIQRMVRSDLAASGVIFTIDTESGFPDVVFITSSYGLGEMVVQGAVNPDEFYVHKPLLAANKFAVVRRSLGSKAKRMVYGKNGAQTHIEDIAPAERQRFSISDADVLDLARAAITIEQHYGRPMDIEWAKDGQDGLLYIVQARPETVKARASKDMLRQYHLKQHSAVLVSGRAIGQRIGSGQVQVILHAAEMNQVQAGDVLVTDMTDPDWEPVMKRAAAIVTNRGGRTCHAAIVARELGIPAVVGCGDATDKLSDGQAVTVSCAEGDTGLVYAGLLETEVREVSLEAMPKAPVKIMMNVGNPERAFDFASLPNDGVGLARLEFIINRMIGIHPKAVLEYPALPSELKHTVEEMCAGYADPVSFYVERLTEGVATIAAAFWPKPVIVRLSDFKSNEYANLVGGERYEPKEENPMLGFRGASRYIAPAFQDCFALECRAMKKVREDMGLVNVELMIPFVRTVEEGKGVIDLLAQHGLVRGENGLRVIMMCEIPSNVILAEEFL